MNKLTDRQKEVIQYELDQEKEVLRQLEKHYQTALNDIDRRIRILESDELTQSKIYRIEYQKALKKQVEATLEKLHADEYATIQGFLSDSYTTGFVGTAYDMFGQGVPLIMPIDKDAAVKAVVTDSKIDVSLYESLGVDTTKLKKTITAEITRGIAAGLPHSDISRNLANAAKVSLGRAKTIVRTESHRIQEASAQDARKMAVSRGASVVKQWKAIMDGKVRHSHRVLDGQIVEVDKPFEIDGMEAMYPGDFGDPSMDCNCRCRATQRAKIALGEEEYQKLQERARFFGLMEEDSKGFGHEKGKTVFSEFKKNYLKAAEKVKAEEARPKFIPAKTREEAEKVAKRFGVKYAEYSKLPIDTANEMNKALLTLPDGVRPVFVGDSSTLEKYWGGKLPRSSKNYYGVTIDAFNGVRTADGFDADAFGQMVGISSSYKTAEKITAAKEASQAIYQARHNGHTWFFNVSGETTPFHEMGHVYVNVKGLPKGFAGAAIRWSAETKCDMISNPEEAWAEAWAAYHTGANELPDYIRKFIEEVVAK